MLYRKILHIDDDEDDQEIFVTALGQVNNKVEYTAHDNPAEALQQLEKKQINPDLIFLDLNMPVMNGQQFLVELKKRTSLKHIPVIILSTSSHIPTINLMKELGAMDFITKPDDFEELIYKLQAILG